MNRSTLLWILASVITLSSGVYQRITGPSYPVSGKAQFAGQTIPYRFDRSHAGESNAPVEVRTDNQDISGVLTWKRYKTSDSWTEVPMIFDGGVLKAELPHQPIAGKLMYHVELQKGTERVRVAGAEPIIIRFRGDVPIYVLIPHLIAMFGAMLCATRAGLEFFSKEPKLKNLVYSTLGFLVVGGFILGPLMQYYSFNVWWTGWPLGTDLTDNKTLVALAAWIVVAVGLSKMKHPTRWALGAAIIMMGVYLIPHSVLGSELKYSEPDKQGVKIDSTR
jgi:hypothetical protein